MATSAVNKAPVYDELSISRFLEGDFSVDVADDRHYTWPMNLLRTRIGAIVAEFKTHLFSGCVVAEPPEFPDFLQATDYRVLRDFISSAGPMLSVVEASTRPPVETMFDAWHLPTGLADQTRERLRTLASALQRVGVKGAICYEGPEGEAVAEFGQAGRALVFLVEQAHTVAMYRAGSPDQYGPPTVLPMRQSPSSLEFEQVAKDYLVALICQTTRTKATSPQTVSLAGG